MKISKKLFRNLSLVDPLRLNPGDLMLREITDHRYYTLNELIDCEVVFVTAISVDYCYPWGFSIEVRLLTQNATLETIACTPRLSEWRKIDIDHNPGSWFSRV